MNARTARFDDRAAQRGMRLSIVEGVAFALMVGLGETFLVADAIRLGASRWQQGLVVSLPLFVGAFGPILALRCLTRLRTRKPFVVGAIAFQSASWVVLATAEARGLCTPTLLIAFAALYQVAGQAAGTAWGSWFGDLVPAAVRGRYFARRNRWVYGGIGLGTLAGGWILNQLETAPAGLADGSGGSGYALLFGLAAVARAGSAILLHLTPEPHFAGVADRGRLLKYVATARGTRAWRLVLVVAALQVAVYIAGPYFVPYALQDLAFSYGELTLGCFVVFFAKVVSLPAWGRAIDQFAPRSVFTLAAVLLALVPLPWLWADGVGWVVIGFAFSGFAWAGFEVSLFSLLVASSYRATRPHVLAAHALMTGAGQFTGGLLGAAIAGVAGQDLVVVFAVSLGARLSVAILAPVFVPARTGEVDPSRSSMFLRVIGLRPNGGVMHRPVVGDEAAP